MKIEEINSKDLTFRYQLLNRLKIDCDYFLGCGQGLVKHLWALNVDDHIQYMKDIWNGFSESEKPEWLTLEDILFYEKRMKGNEE